MLIRLTCPSLNCVPVLVWVRVKKVGSLSLDVLNVGKVLKLLDLKLGAALRSLCWALSDLLAGSGDNS